MNPEAIKSYILANWQWLSFAVAGAYLVITDNLDRLKAVGGKVGGKVGGLLKKITPARTDIAPAPSDPSAVDIDRAWSAIKVLDEEYAKAAVDATERKKLFVDAVARLRPEAAK